MYDNIINLTAGRELIVVMPDASTGWYSNPVSSNTGPRNWETFHIAQLLPWIELNFRAFAEYNGRAVGGLSMGGFGALKYTAKYYGHFCSVSSHSGPASLVTGEDCGCGPLSEPHPHRLPVVAAKIRAAQSKT